MNDIVEFHLTILRIAGILFVFIFGVPIGHILLYSIVLFSVSTYRIMKNLLTGRPAGEIIKFGMAATDKKPEWHWQCQKIVLYCRIS